MALDGVRAQIQARGRSACCSGPAARKLRTSISRVLSRGSPSTASRPSSGPRVATVSPAPPSVRALRPPLAVQPRPIGPAPPRQEASPRKAGHRPPRPSHRQQRPRAPGLAMQRPARRAAARPRRATLEWRRRSPSDPRRRRSSAATVKSSHASALRPSCNARRARKVPLPRRGNAVLPWAPSSSCKSAHALPVVRGRRLAPGPRPRDVRAPVRVNGRREHVGHEGLASGPHALLVPADRVEGHGSAEQRHPQAPGLAKPAALRLHALDGCARRLAMATPQEQPGVEHGRRRLQRLTGIAGRCERTLHEAAHRACNARPADHDVEPRDASVPELRRRPLHQEIHHSSQMFGRTRGGAVDPCAPVPEKLDQGCRPGHARIGRDRQRTAVRLFEPPEEQQRDRLENARLERLPGPALPLEAEPRLAHRFDHDRVLELVPGAQPAGIRQLGRSLAFVCRELLDEAHHLRAFAGSDENGREFGGATARPVANCRLAPAWAPCALGRARSRPPAAPATAAGPGTVASRWSRKSRNRSCSRKVSSSPSSTETNRPALLHLLQQLGRARIAADLGAPAGGEFGQYRSRSRKSLSSGGILSSTSAAR